MFYSNKQIVATEKQQAVTYTDYQITLDEAVDIQVHTNASPITDIYRNTPAYVDANDVKIVHPKIAPSQAPIYTAPSTESEVAYHFPKNVPVHLTGLELERAKEEAWYKIAYQTNTYYVQKKHIDAYLVETTTETTVHEGPVADGHVFGNVPKGKQFTIAGDEAEWMHVFYQPWRTPKPEDIKMQLDPDDENMFQHIRLDKTIGVTATELDKVLEGKGILEGLGSAFIAGGKKHKINEAYLMAHALHESGLGTSDLATGVEVGINEHKEPTIVTDENRESLKKIKTTYNMFGIGAADRCPLECGAITAYENGWFTPEKAIKDGAAWIGKGFIYNEFKQNTLYKMRWNPRMGEGYDWKQYATDIGWAKKQTASIKEIYEQLTDPKYYYDMPTYVEK